MATNVSDEAAGKASPTIYDVAHAAGVSPSTVSRALNKPGRVNAITEKMIREHADALGYQLNPMARAVITGKTGTLALILSDITNPVYFDLIRGAGKICAAEGRTLVLAETQESAETEHAITQRLRVSVDGLVLVASRMHDDQIRALARSKPVVVVNRRVDGVPSVVPETESSLGAALDHLFELGHRSVGYLAGPIASWMNAFRWSTLFESALARGMSIVEISSTAPTLQGGRDSLKRVLASGVTAVLAYNDLIAMGLLAEAKAQGIDVPGRLSIVGFDDIFGADLLTPALTTLRSPLREIGAHAISALVDGGIPQLAAPPATEFIPRSSTGSPSRAV
jgi:LacI family transcriptional regulator